MSIEASAIPGAVAVGIGATLGMDLWNLFLKRAFDIPSLNYCLLGRWLRHMPQGTLRQHRPRARFVTVTSGDWLARPTLRPAQLYGLVIVVFPFFVLQPSFGLGIAGSKTPDPAQIRRKSLVTHTVFGLGLYFCALGLSRLLYGSA